MQFVKTKWASCKAQMISFIDILFCAYWKWNEKLKLSVSEVLTFLCQETKFCTLFPVDWFPHQLICGSPKFEWNGISHFRIWFQLMAKGVLCDQLVRHLK